MGMGCGPWLYLHCRLYGDVNIDRVVEGNHLSDLKLGGF